MTNPIRRYLDILTHHALLEATDEKIPAIFPVFPDDRNYPWGPQGERQREAEQKMLAINAAQRQAKVVDIPYAGLIAIEDTVYKDKMEQYRKTPSDELPFVYHHNGKNYIWDGNHRLTAAVLNGKTHGLVMFCDLDPVLDATGRLRTH